MNLHEETLSGFFMTQRSMSKEVGQKVRVKHKVIYTKYSKHCPYTVAHTFECVCSKINHGLNHGLFISLLKLILCPIH